MDSLPFPVEEYRQRQEKLLEKLSQNSIVIIPTNPISKRSNDVGYPFRANSYMIYLCDWTYPEGILVFTHESGGWKSTLFVQPPDTKKEIWEGRRIGLDKIPEYWPVDVVLSKEEAPSFLEKHIDIADNVFHIEGLNDELDRIITRNGSFLDPREHLDIMRSIKSPLEQKQMIRSAEIASSAHISAMRNTYPGIGEWEIQSIIEGNFMSQNSQWSYPSIVGGGDNATILHYNSNNSKVNSGELVLVDAGCEVNGYASDITRTWPVNGKFSEPQKEIYNLVLKAEIAGIEACQPGSPWLSMHKATSQIIAQGLIDLGILKCSLEEAIGPDFDGPYRNYFMHGTGHFLGLDVHDVGGGRQGDDDPGPVLQPGMVLTVEPGLYFASWRADVDIPERYSGIGVRIEDDVLITSDGPVIISEACPKNIEEIELLVGSLR